MSGRRPEGGAEQHPALPRICFLGVCEANLGEAPNIPRCEDGLHLTIDVDGNGAGLKIPRCHALPTKGLQSKGTRPDHYEDDDGETIRLF